MCIEKKIIMIGIKNGNVGPVWTRGILVLQRIFLFKGQIRLQVTNPFRNDPTFGFRSEVAARNFNRSATVSGPPCSSALHDHLQFILRDRKERIS